MQSSATLLTRNSYVVLTVAIGGAVASLLASSGIVAITTAAVVAGWLSNWSG
jgi:uncharacterized membrane protein